MLDSNAKATTGKTYFATRTADRRCNLVTFAAAAQDAASV
jgi:hypothetical protein